MSSPGSESSTVRNTRAKHKQKESLAVDNPALTVDSKTTLLQSSLETPLLTLTSSQKRQSPHDFSSPKRRLAIKEEMSPFQILRAISRLTVHTTHHAEKQVHRLPTRPPKGKQKETTHDTTFLPVNVSPPPPPFPLKRFVRKPSLQPLPPPLAPSMKLWRHKNRQRDFDEPEASLSSISYHSDTDFSRLNYQLHGSSDDFTEASLSFTHEERQQQQSQTSDLPYGWHTSSIEGDGPRTPLLIHQVSQDIVSLDPSSEKEEEPWSQGEENQQGMDLGPVLPFDMESIFGGEDDMIDFHDKQQASQEREEWHAQEQEKRISDHPRIVSHGRFGEYRMKIIEEARLAGEVEEQKMPVGVQLQRQLFTRHTTKRVNAGATKAIVKASELFFEQLMDDLKAYTQHSDRTKVTLQDMKLLMQRQRLITKTKAVELLAHTHLPREMWDLVCRSATANNELFPDHLE